MTRPHRANLLVASSSSALKAQLAEV